DRAKFAVRTMSSPLESRVTLPVDSEPDDAAVGVLFAAGDERALAWAYERGAGLGTGLACRALGAGQEAEDVTQLVFVTAWTAREAYRPDRGPFAAWLVGICRL